MFISLETGITLITVLVGALFWLLKTLHRLEIQIKELEKKIEVQDKTFSEFKAYTDMIISLLKNQLNKQ